jgi:hypothetical protein
MFVVFKRLLFFFVSLFLCGGLTFAQTKAERGIVVREAQLYISPDAKSAKLGTVDRGREVVVMDNSKEFIKVFAEMGQGKNVTGWMIDRGVVRENTPNGDRILFGEAADSENEAAKRGGRKGADRDALRLYYRVNEYFPKSELAGEALWRAADINWQLEKSDLSLRKSSREMDPGLRPKINTELMDDVRKKFPGTKWHALASFAKIDNKLCGEWRGLPKCPEQESEQYEEYVKEHPQSPKAAEALYEAAYRQAALVDIYKGDGNASKSDDAKKRALDLARRIITQYPQQGDWAAKAQSLIFKLEQGIAIYGTGIE